GGAVLAVESRVHGAVTVLQDAAPILVAGQVSDHRRDAGALQRLGMFTAAGETEHPVSLAHEARRDGTADVAGGSGDEDALVHGPLPDPRGSRHGFRLGRAPGLGPCSGSVGGSLSTGSDAV